MKEESFTEFKKTKRTTQNPINKSGDTGEKIFEDLIKNRFPKLPYRASKSGKSAIDFIINPTGKKEDRLYVDVKYQHTGGGRDGAVAHTVWLYKKKYDYKLCHIAEGPFSFKESVREHSNEICETHFVKFEEMMNIIENKYYSENSKKQIITKRKFF